MKVFVYYKNGSEPYIVFDKVTTIEETEKKLCFTFPDKSTFEIDKKQFKTTAYQN